MNLYPLLKPLLFQLDPEEAHDTGPGDFGDVAVRDDYVKVNVEGCR